ncbi:MAG: hypothetical protein GF313_08115 [Caldithrix sp.]|nr:hypothetical protein [Caldithrix sp.]
MKRINRNGGNWQCIACPTMLFHFLFIVLFLDVCHGQDRMAPVIGDRPFFMDSVVHQVNLYDIGHNTAALYEDSRTRALRVGQFTDYSDGDYYWPLHAETVIEQNYFAGTVYPLSENDVFKGYFYYRRQNDHNVQWVDQSRWLQSNPFLLGDSSRGDFTLNGIHWGGEWARRVNQHWLFGLGVHYSVGQRLKKVFPKPLNKYRDLNLTAGVMYRADRWQVGFNYRYFNQQEKVEISRYNLNQDITPVIYKFRYTDLPEIRRGQTSEERQLDRIGHEASGQWLWKTSFVHWLGHLRYAVFTAGTRDGGIQKEKEGDWDTHLYNAALIMIKQTTEWKGYLSYHFARDAHTAYHPLFQFLIMEKAASRHQFTLGGQLNVTKNCKLFTDLLYWYHGAFKEDLMLNNFWQLKGHGYGLKGGMLYTWGNRWQAAAWMGTAVLDNQCQKRSENIYERTYFNLLYRDPLNYYLADTQRYNLGLQITYKYLPVLETHLLLSAQTISGEEPSALTKSRVTLNGQVIIDLFIF